MLRFNNLPPSEQVYLRYFPIPLYSCSCGIPVLEYPDGSLIEWNNLPYVDLPDDKNHREYAYGEVGEEGENAFFHTITEASITVHAEEQCGLVVNSTEWYGQPVQEIFWPGRQRFSVFYPLPGEWTDPYLPRYHYKVTGSSLELTVDDRPDLYILQKFGIADHDGRRMSYVETIRPNQSSDITWYRLQTNDPLAQEITNPGSIAWQYALHKAIIDVDYYTKYVAPTYFDKAAHWHAAQDAVDGIQVYNINMVEGLLNLGLDDLIPLKASATSIKMLEEALKGGFVTKALRCLQIAATMYLQMKYVTDNDIRDVCALLNISPDVSDWILKISKSLTDDGVTADDYNHQLGTIAKKIVYGEDYMSHTYGASSANVPSPFGSSSRCRTHAKLVCTPGPLADLSAWSIITEDFGLKLSATRLIEAVPFEFIVNWFLPIEQLVKDIEFNDSHLRALYRVRTLTISDKVTFECSGRDLGIYLGLHHCSGYVRSTYYKRTVSDSFPPTRFSFSLNTGAITGSRIMQGGALLITS